MFINNGLRSGIYTHNIVTSRYKVNQILEKHCTRTLKNVTRNLFKINNYDEASVPTVCASLIDGKTHFRSLRISVGRKQCNTTTPHVVIKIQGIANVGMIIRRFFIIEG